MLRRLLILMATIVLLAGACGGDSSDDADTATSDSSSDSDSSDSDDSDDSGDSGDSGDSADSSDSGDSGDSSSGSDDSDDADAPRSLDCDEVNDALDRAGDSIELDPTAGADDVEASFNQARAQLQALADEVPELSEHVDTALAGMDVVGEALASLDWDASNMATNPEAALEFASLMSDPAVIGMTEAFTHIGTWIATSCT